MINNNSYVSCVHVHVRVFMHSCTYVCTLGVHYIVDALLHSVRQRLRVVTPDTDHRGGSLRRVDVDQCVG